MRRDIDLKTGIKRSRREMKTYCEGYAETNWKKLICNNNKIKWEDSEELILEGLRRIRQGLEKTIKMRNELE